MLGKKEFLIWKKIVMILSNFIAKIGSYGNPMHFNFFQLSALRFETSA